MISLVLPQVASSLTLLWSGMMDPPTGSARGASFSGSTEGVSEESLGLDSIVTPDSRFVLVEGAGMGKSTLCWELCRK